MMGDVAPAGQHQALVGRDNELSELSALLGVRPPRVDGAVVPNAVLLAGDAGVGKTRLLTELRDVAFAEGWQVVAGHCLDFGDSALPYLPFSEVLARLLTDLPDVVDEVGALHPGLARLQPGRRMLSLDDVEASSVDRSEVMAAMHALLGAAAAATPLLLVIEDVHWADRSTRDMLSYLFARPFAAPLGIVVSYRAEDLHRRHPLRATAAEWSRIRGVERIQLDPLSEADVRELVRELSPSPVGEAALAGIVDRAEGNAFFVEELVGAAQSPAGRVPEDLADVLLVRLEQLDDDAVQVVRATSVAGRRVSHALLTAASGLGPDALDRALRSAVESHVLVISHDDTYAFRHALLAEAVYDDLLPGERVRLHAAYVEALRHGAGRGTAAELARHARAAMDLPTALAASVQAGDEALAVGGPDEAAGHYERALELVVDPDLAKGVDVPGLVVKASEALVASGIPHRAATLVERHLAGLTDEVEPATRARLHIQLAFAAGLYDNDVDWRAHADRAFALIPADSSVERAALLAVYARVMASYGKPEARAAALEALALSEEHDLPKVAADAATTVVHLDQRGQVPTEQVAAALEDAARRAGQTGAVNSELRALYLLGRGYQDRGMFDAACDAFARATERAQEIGRPWAPYAFDCRFMHAQIAYLAGRWEQALVLTDVQGQSPPAIAEAMLTSLRTAILAARGEDLAPTFARLRKYWRKDGVVAIFAAPVEAEVLGHAGAASAAVGVIDEVVGVLTRTWREHFQARVRLSTTGIGAIANAASGLSAEERAELAAAAERLHGDARRTLEFHERAGAYWGPEGRAWTSRLEAEMLRVRWLLDVEPPTHDALADAWRDAEARFADLGHVHELAVTRTRLAAVLRAAGDATAARGVADQAREAAQGLGATVVLEELRELGTSPQRASTPAATALTRRETEILALVAEGRSNGEIGRHLFISTKTVSVHVSNILGKLGASGRTEAAAIGRRRGLIDA